VHLPGIYVDHVLQLTPEQAADLPIEKRTVRARGADSEVYERGARGADSEVDERGARGADSEVYERSARGADTEVDRRTRQDQEEH
jgi:hypothetical protein